MSDGTSCLKVGLLGRQASVEEPSFAPGKCIEACLERAVNLIVQTGDRGEDDWLQSCAVLHQLKRIALIKANLESAVEREAEQTLLKRVREGQV